MADPASEATFVKIEAEMEKRISRLRAHDGGIVPVKFRQRLMYHFLPRSLYFARASTLSEHQLRLNHHLLPFEVWIFQLVD